MPDSEELPFNVLLMPLPTVTGSGLMDFGDAYYRSGGGYRRR